MLTFIIEAYSSLGTGIMNPTSECRRNLNLKWWLGEEGEAWWKDSKEDETSETMAWEEKMLFQS